MVSFLMVSSSKNYRQFNYPTNYPSVFLQTSYYSNNRSAGKFNVGRVNSDRISKIGVNAIGLDPMTNYFEGKH